MVFVILTSAAIGSMAGENVDATGWTATNQEAWELQGISYLCNLCRYNFADNYSALNTDVKHTVFEYICRYIALSGIAYNMAGYTSRIEAENMINIHIWRMNKIEKLLQDQKAITYLKGA